MAYMFFQKNCLHVVLFSFVCMPAFMLPAGFIAGTLVKVPCGHMSIEQIKAGDKIISIDFYKMFTYGKVMCIAHKKSDRLIKITVDDEFFVVAPDQFFYAPHQGWVQADRLQSFMRLLSMGKECVRIENVEVIECCAEVYTLSLEDTGIFFISGRNIIAYNFTYGIYRSIGGRIYDTASSAIKVSAKFILGGF